MSDVLVDSSTNNVSQKQNNKSPMVRFDGFTDDWEHRKLKQLGEIQTGNTPSTNNIKNYDDGGILWVTPTDIKSLTVINTAKKLSTEGAKKARIAKAGSILVTCIASIGKNTLATKDVGFNQQINSLTPFSENDSYFLLTQSKIWSEKMKQSAASGTMQIVNKSEFSNITTMIPEFKEQIKIGNFFKQIDNTIALHQRKLAAWYNVRKWAYQKILNRLKDESSAHTLGELVDITTGKLDVNANDPAGKYPFFTCSSDTYRIDEYAFDDEALLIAGNGNLGVVKYYNGKFNAYQRTYVITKDNNSDLDIRFLHHMLDYGLIDYLNSYTVGTTISYITLKSLMSMPVFVPSLKEQQKIGSFFNTMDGCIEAQQTKIKQLQEMKNALLQRMFV